MEELPHIITDLCMIMMVAGLVTIIFKRLKQPLVLGYIMAGFLAGPHMPYTPTVSEQDTVEIWSQIGVIFMMFALGLEFSFKKIFRMGMAPVIASVSIMTCMMGVGCGVGMLFSWSSMNCLFLGGMLAMSSTTIIYKAFNDLGIQNKKFASGVMSVLILEDILGILLMVILSAMAVSQKFEGGALMMSLFKLGFFLLLWFVVGIYLIPLFLKRNSKFINSETLLIVSVGLCFAMVVLASKAGYSAAFGAFMMGSILAETVEAERIEKAISSVKDLFGAIFFVSVGMLVDPHILVAYWLPILIITIAILLGQTLFGTMSFVLSGQDLRSGMQSGFSMAQIGEFAFIIAQMGVDKGVMSDYLYPVVVAVSIVTTFLTPYMIKGAEPAYHLVEKYLPERVKTTIERKSAGRKGHAETAEMEGLSSQSTGQVWKSVLGALLRQTVVYMVISAAIIMVSLPTVLITCRSIFGHWVGNAICGVLTLIFVSPFLRAVVMRKNHSEEFKYLVRQGKWHMYGVFLTFFVRYALAVDAVYYIFNYLSPFWWVWHVLASMVVVYLMCVNRKVKLTSIRIERTFRHNLLRREIVSAQQQKDGSMAYARRLQGRDLHIVRLTLPYDTLWAGKTLSQLNFGREDNILIASVIRHDMRINIPGGDVMLFPQDTLEVVGDDISIEQLSRRMDTEVCDELFSHERLSISCITLTSESEYIGLTLQESQIRTKMQCMVIGFEEEDGTISIASADHIFAVGDKMWLVGNNVIEK